MNKQIIVSVLNKNEQLGGKLPSGSLIYDKADNKFYELKQPSLESETISSLITKWEVDEVSWSGGGGSSWGAVSSVFGRTWDVTSAFGDYNSDQIREGANNKFLLASDKAKLDNAPDDINDALLVKEDFLGTPKRSGKVLTSDRSGVRSWMSVPTYLAIDDLIAWELLTDRQVVRKGNATYWEDANKYYVSHASNEHQLDFMWIAMSDETIGGTFDMAYKWVVWGFSSLVGGQSFDLNKSIYIEQITSDSTYDAAGWVAIGQTFTPDKNMKLSNIKVRSENTNQVYVQLLVFEWVKQIWASEVNVLNSKWDAEFIMSNSVYLKENTIYEFKLVETGGAPTSWGYANGGNAYLAWTMYIGATADANKDLYFVINWYEAEISKKGSGVYLWDDGIVTLSPWKNIIPIGTVFSDTQIELFDNSDFSGLTKENVELSNVDNTSDEDKPISAATQAVLNEMFSSLWGKQNTIWYTTENVANKSVNMTTDTWSDVKYPSVKAVEDYVSANAWWGEMVLLQEANLQTPVSSVDFVNFNDLFTYSSFIVEWTFAPANNGVKFEVQASNSTTATSFGTLQMVSDYVRTWDNSYSRNHTSGSISPNVSWGNVQVSGLWFNMKINYHPSRYTTMPFQTSYTDAATGTLGYCNWTIKYNGPIRTLRLKFSSWNINLAGGIRLYWIKA